MATFSDSSLLPILVVGIGLYIGFRLFSTPPPSPAFAAKKKKVVHHKIRTPAQQQHIRTVRRVTAVHHPHHQGKNTVTKLITGGKSHDHPTFKSTSPRPILHRQSLGGPAVTITHKNIPVKNETDYFNANTRGTYLNHELVTGDIPGEAAAGEIRIQHIHSGTTVLKPSNRFVDPGITTTEKVGSRLTPYTRLRSGVTTGTEDEEAPIYSGTNLIVNKDPAYA